MRTRATQGRRRLAAERLPRPGSANAPVADVAGRLGQRPRSPARTSFAASFVERGSERSHRPDRSKANCPSAASITGQIVQSTTVLDPGRQPPSRTSPGLKGPFGCLNQRPLRHRLGRAWAPPKHAGTPPARVHPRTASSSAAPSPPPSSSRKKLADMQTEITLGLHGALSTSVTLIDEGRKHPP